MSGVGKAARTAPGPPDLLLGDHVRTFFVRHDIAKTKRDVCDYVLQHYGILWASYELEEVEMLPVPDYFTGIEWGWATVAKGTPDAVRYWRFRWL